MDLGVVLIIAAIIVCFGSANGSSDRSNFFLLFLSLVLLSIGTYLTRLAPYVAFCGVGLLILAVTRWPDSKTTKGLARAGVAALLSAVIVIVLNLFASPSNDEVEVEDRTEWQEPEEGEITPQEVLAIEWSTHDPYSDWPAARLMCELCDIAYAPPVDARGQISKLGFDSESINAGSMQGYVIDAGNDSIIVLRGTERHEYDILQDLRFLKERSEQGSMHGGFVNGYMPMHSQVSKLLDKYQTKRVWITGHSLGGGLAIVCAHQLIVDKQYFIAGVMTFGQPKVVREDMATFLSPHLDGKYVFFVNDMDPVTRLIDPYVHFGHMVRWTDTEIERSRMMLQSKEFGAEPDVPQFETESGYVESMSDAELNGLIQGLQDSQKPKFDKDGNQIYQGFFPNVFDHFLSSYKGMLENLRTHKPQE